MCGIAGLYGSFKTEEREQAAGALLEQLAHRGPDGCGIYNEADITLLHTRLSIIDLTENGNQPLFNEDRSLVLVCNGEIYNYQQLTKELMARGHRFMSHSDCEIILHLYEENPDDPAKIINALTGMFAFALWDTKRRRLLVARDRIGIKPLYYSFSDGKLVFASEVRPIVRTGLVNKAYDLTSVYEYFLTSSVPAPNTLYRAVKVLPAGHYMTVENGRMNISGYWDIPCGAHRWKSDGEVQEAVDSLLSEVVKDHLIADVPVGTFLSAGIDSSLIAAYAVKHHPGIHSFTASFPGEPEDEGKVAAETARRLGTTHHSYELKGDFFTDFDEQLQDIDQPFAPNSALSLGRISKMARRDVKVVLSGDGADELFGGYYRHDPPQRPDFLKRIPRVLQQDVLKIGAKVTGRKSLEALRQNLALPAGDTFLSKVAVTDKEDVLSLFAPEIKKQIDTERFSGYLNRCFDGREDRDELNRILYAEMKTALVDEMMTKCDRMTMMNGIEGRVPFLDHRLVELAFSIPGEYKRMNGIGKLILRKLVAEKLGNELAYRKKTGFNSPLLQWLDTDLKTREYVERQFAAASQMALFDKNTMMSYGHTGNRVPDVLVYALVCFSHFMQHEDTGSDK